ncbi:MAG: phosphopantetheine-binding protein, partial [Planctomycetaceae bacterium]
NAQRQEAQRQEAQRQEAQRQEAQRQEAQPVAVSQQAAVNMPPPEATVHQGGNGHLPVTPSEQHAAPTQGAVTGSRLRPTGEGDSLVDILSGMYEEHGVVPPLAESPAGAVDRFWRALAEMFDLSVADRESVMGAADSDALVRLLTGAGGKAEWLDATPAASPKEVPSASPSPAVPVSLDSGQVATEIEAFLIDFVVDQTGYPEEIIELDVDLEADLGIDSIRKAQMMGEVGQKYGLEADPELSLDDFPTLRHLLDYIVPRIAGGSDESADDMNPQVQSQAKTLHSQSNGDYLGNGHADVAAEPMTSAAYQAGLEIGRAHSDAIHQWSRSVTQSSINHSVDCLFESVLQEKLEGIAKGAEVEVALLTAAVSDPTRVVGNCDLLLDLPSPESNVAGRVRGFAMSFTRHIQMDHIRFHENNLSGCLVTATGMPGAVVGWNDAGIVAILGPCATDESPVSPGMPAGQVIQQIAQRCRSFDDVQQTIDRGDLERPPAGMSVLVADLASGGIREITPRGEIYDRGNQLVCRNRISPLTRILTDGDSQNTAHALAEIASNHSAAALSAACSWLA